MKRLVFFIACLGLLGPAVSNAAKMDTRFYGYVDGYVESVQDQPGVDNSGARTELENSPEFDVPNLHVIVRSNYEDTTAFINLSGGGAGAVDVRTAWVDKQLLGEYLSFRIGELYRPFGLYNLILDAVPTYIGIEPPELFDGDHFLVTRTTNAMLHGKVNVGGTNFINYAMTTGNDERESDQLPVGLDVNFTMGTTLKAGVSYYTSGGAAVYNEDNPGGVVRWAEQDKFDVMGLYLQWTDPRWTVQLAGFQASHELVRDTGSGDYGLTTICSSANLSANSRTRFGCDSTLDSEEDYDVNTWYLRVGYNFNVGDMGQLVPYFQYDVYENEEVIFDKDFGGDKEAGLADDGKFTKWTLGTVYRPHPAAAFKIDYSQHVQDVQNESTNYGEIRFSYSYVWRL